MAIKRDKLFISALVFNLENHCTKEVSQTSPVLLKLFEDYKPDSETKLLIEQADRYARGEDSPSKIELPSNSNLYSVFESLLRERRESITQKYAYKKSSVSFDEGFFPKPLSELGNDSGDEIWKSFIQELEKLDVENEKVLGESLLALLDKYCSHLPFDDSRLKDVSLYDHIKTRAALSICLYDCMDGRNTLPSDAEAPILLVKASISGIQDFIYDIISKYAAKNLKGRSFYLQLLIDSVLTQLLNKLELNSAHIVYASGGSFFLLVPNTEKNANILDTQISRISEQIFKNHKTTLYLALVHSTMTGGDLLNGRLSEIWQGLFDKLAEAKKKRFSKKLIVDYALFFEPSEVGGQQPRDVITGEEISEEFIRKKKYKTVEDDDDKKILLGTFSQIELGKTLRKSDYWVKSLQEIKVLESPHRNYAYDPCGVGVHNYLIDKETFAKHLDVITGLEGNVSVSTFNDPDFIQESNVTNLSYSYRFYGGNKFPSDEEGNVIHFDQLAGVPTDEEKEKGRRGISFKRLGILRMDVDSLGRIFRMGMRKDAQTFSRYSTLSRGLDYFFMGYLNKIWQDDPHLKENTFILYAGGDDLFIVGRWNSLIVFAERIHLLFKQWTCGNPNFSISGGLAIVTPRFPISKAADMAAQAEKLAKKHTYHLGEQKLEKNSFTLLEVALNWDYEYPLVVTLKDKLLDLIKNHQMPKSFLGKIKEHYGSYMDQLFNGKTERWRWIMAYDFSQTAKRIKNPGLKEEVRKIAIGAFTHQYPGYTRNENGNNKAFIELLHLAARWAELEIRTSEEIR